MKWCPHFADGRKLFNTRLISSSYHIMFGPPPPARSTAVTTRTTLRTHHFSVVACVGLLHLFFHYSIIVFHFKFNFLFKLRRDSDMSWIHLILIHSYLKNRSTLPNVIFFFRLSSFLKKVLVILILFTVTKSLNIPQFPVTCCSSRTHNLRH